MSIKQNEVKVIITGPVGAGKSALSGLLANALRFINVPFHWGDERAEVNLTGGDWVKQLKDSNPKVTIIERLIDDSEKRTGLSFSDALKALEEGKSVYREGWNGKGMFVYLVPANEYPAQTGAAKEYFGENSMVPYNAYFAIKNVNETVSTWVPSVNDCLAKDWCITLDTNVE